MRIAMNKMCHPPTLYRLGPALLLCSFLIAGCAVSPSEVRYDDRMKTSVVAQNEIAEPLLSTSMVKQQHIISFDREIVLTFNQEPNNLKSYTSPNPLLQRLQRLSWPIYKWS